MFEKSRKLLSTVKQRFIQRWAIICIKQHAEPRIDNGERLKKIECVREDMISTRTDFDFVARIELAYIVTSSLLYLSESSLTSIS